MEQFVSFVPSKESEKMILIQNAELVNEGAIYKASVLIENERIAAIYKDTVPQEVLAQSTIINAEGLLLLPGIIDDQVHFREPGLTHKGNIFTESRAAVAGGITSFMDMPNTIPQTTTIEALNEKFERASQESLANYSFFIGATNDNLNELKKEGAKRAAAVKLFMGSSTGNMLVDDSATLDRIFSEIQMIIAAHCESEEIIRANKEYYTKKFGENLDISFHPKIRSCEACFASSGKAVELARKYNSRFHLFHLSTAMEMELLDAGRAAYAGWRAAGGASRRAAPEGWKPHPEARSVIANPAKAGNGRIMHDLRSARRRGVRKKDR